MLEKCEERVKLIRAGISNKTIERLYIEANKFIIINVPPFVELVEIDIPVDKNNYACHKAAAKCT